MRSLKLKNQWGESNKSDGESRAKLKWFQVPARLTVCVPLPVFWKSRERTMLHNINMDIAGKDGKQNKYMATPTSRANSYESLVEIYRSKVDN